MHWYNNRYALSSAPIINFNSYYYYNCIIVYYCHIIKKNNYNNCKFQYHIILDKYIILLSQDKRKTSRHQ